MKRFLLTIAMAALAFSAIPRANAEVSVDFFYNNLDGGSWYETSDYGYVWQPESASSSSWRPYADGYWAYTDVGWTWVSYEDFGWATYHYGNWARIADRGWCWVPGTEWGGAWVSWRTGGDYVGWAPLPPVRGQLVYEGRAITGNVDVEFDIGPAYYNFIDVRYMGEPVLRSHIYDYNQNITYVNKTVNVTNITYNDNRVYNYGPDYDRVSKYSVKPIQKLEIKRQADFDPSAAKGAFTKVQGNQLLVGGPMKLQKAEASEAPKTIKAKLSRPKYETGWEGVKDPAAKEKLVQKFKSENAKNVPPPDVQPKGGAQVGATGPTGVDADAGGGGSPAAAATAAPSANAGADTQIKGNGKHKVNKQSAPGAAAASDTGAGTGTSTTTSGDIKDGGKGKGKREGMSDVQNLQSQGAEGPTGAPDQTGEALVSPKANEPIKKHKTERTQDVAVPATPGPVDIAPGDGQGLGKHKGRHFSDQPPTNGAAQGGSDPNAVGGGRKNRVQPPQQFGGGNPPSDQGAPRDAGHKKGKGEPVATPTP